ncbi:MAG: serine/threonine-protein phosphatase, partial [Planctomycetes bacterium]|nr:serine/threonine-protein phosphatase [Planctomycetota bacterium]
VKSSFQFEWGKQEGREPAPINTILDTVAHNTAKEISNIGSFISMFYCRIDTKNKSIHYIDCGSTKPILCTSNTETQELHGSDTLFGLFEDSPPSTIHNITYKEDDTLTLYSDGIIEAVHKNTDELYGEERLHCDLKSNYTKSASNIGNCIRKSVKDFSGKSNNLDDFTVAILKFSDNDATIKHMDFSKSIEVELYSHINTEFFNNAVKNTYPWITENILSLAWSMLNIISRENYDDEESLPIWLSIESHDEKLVLQYFDYGQASGIEIYEKFIHATQSCDINDISLDTDPLARNHLSININKD